ncbi:MAG TPA: AAA family ATPase, partial [Polyangiaceae bacterium]|nr:AAA family ATPase [Polyangiaceae bacterium]
MIREAEFASVGAIPARIAEWKGTDRYQVRRCIGTGSVGAVYEAYDVERGQKVALKRLRHFGPAALYAFKQEFRTLADVHDPHLVRLFELVATDANEFFFTMELVPGIDLVRHVQMHLAGDYDGIRAIVRQLAQGVHALHTAGKLHRDVKPSNVLVTPEGRVVLLDFGLATESSPGLGGFAGEDHPIVGTAHYMAPEQSSGGPLGPWSDWYSVGAVLFEALVGGPPFVGPARDVLRMKRALDAPRPSASVPDVPSDLDELCAALLRRAPESRPGGAQVLASLGVHGANDARPSRAPPSDPGAAKLVGREEHLQALLEAFEGVRSGRCITVFVGGPSGMGKSALAQTFVDELARRGAATVLRARVYERELVPYKAVDGWIDALSRHLLRLSDSGELMDLPKDTWALARLFPVLRRVPEVAEVREQAVGDPYRARRRAFGALREILASLARVQPVVLYVDDAHWGDADSAALWADLVRPPHAPPMLLLVTYREDEAAASPFFVELRSHWPTGAEAQDLAVGPLPDADAQRLAFALLGSRGDTAQAAARSLASEARGSPLLIEELARCQRGIVHSTAPPSSGSALEQSVAERWALLPGGARRLLEMVAASGRPLPLATAAAAAELPGGGDDAAAALVAARFVRAGLRNGREVVEIRHDRIRDALLARVPAEAIAQHHGRLARVLEAAPKADPESVAVHLVGAGEKERAWPYAMAAAERSIAKLAFDRATELFRMALAGVPPASRHESALRVRLAEALSWAGRGAESARAYLEAATGEPGLRRVELERAAAEQLLTCGRIEEGARVLRGVLAEFGMTAPRSKWAALFWLVIYRLRGAVLGVRFTERDGDRVSAEDRVRIDAIYAVAMGLAVVDVVLGACMQARHYLVALRAGDRFQVLRALGIEIGHLASLGGPRSRRETDALEAARSLASRAGGADAQAYFEMTDGAALFLRGRWDEARAALDSAAARHPHGRAHWQSTGQIFAVNALQFAGAIREMRRRQARLAADARDRGDLYTTVNIDTTVGVTALLAVDDPEGARRAVREALAQWSQTAFFVQQWQAMAFEADIDLYLGDGAAAYARVKRDLRALGRSHLLTVQFIRVMTLYARGRCAAASIGAAPSRRRARVAEAHRAARAIEREAMEWTAPLAAAVRAVAYHGAGDRHRAAAALREA